MMRSFKANVSPCFILMRFLSRHFMAYLEGKGGQGELWGKWAQRTNRTPLREQSGGAAGRVGVTWGEQHEGDEGARRGVLTQGPSPPLAPPSGVPAGPGLTSCPCQPSGTRRPRRSPLAQ